jgi:hypothetical protein
MLACQRKKLPRKGAVKGKVLNLKSVEGSRMYKDRLYEMELRQGLRCAICERTAGSRMEFDHQDGRGMNGGHRSDEILDDKGAWINTALCHDCNSKKGSQRYKWVNGVYQQVVRVREVA